MAQREFFASCLPGLEQLLAAELKSFGIERVRPLSGGAAFFCEPEGSLRACLWSRLASRIMLVVGRVDAPDADALYAGVRALPWEDMLAQGATMAVRAHGSNENLRNARFTALKVKDAIVDRMRENGGQRPVIDKESPRSAVDVRVRGERATVSLDFSGEALSRRTYLAPDDREDSTLACSLAAAMLAAGKWDAAAGGGAAFIDPVCRDGIVLVEAASVACDLAPGLHRQKWGFEGWAEFESTVWEALQVEAEERFREGLARYAGEKALSTPQSGRLDLSQVRIAGASTSSPNIAKSRDHVRRAGLRPVVTVELADAAAVGELVDRVARVAQRRPLHVSNERAAEEGADSASCPLMVASNIDAPSRTDSAAHVQADESAFLAACSAAPAGSRFAVSGAQDAGMRFPAGPTSSTVVGRGRIETRIDVYDQPPSAGQSIEVPDLEGGAPHRVDVLEAASGQFAARLRKVFKERRKWAARQGVTCYRIYDADLQDYAVAIDVYAGAGGARGNKYLHIAEYAPPASVDADRARRRFSDVLAIAPIVCGVRPDHVFSKTRLREKGGSQYRNAGQRAYVTTVGESDYLFEVDLAGRLDTGLFLDHRLTRALIGEKANGARFLNLFAYTGTASVYAAGGGARSTLTVDLSQTYLDWARRNMAANGFSGSEHAFQRADVMRWITEARRSGKRFDLIFVDPPTFSNSKAMGRRTWDVQRDHVELLIGVSHLLSEQGTAVFSCNLRSFKPAVEELERYGVSIEDISPETIPADFVRTPTIHKCYLVQ